MELNRRDMAILYVICKHNIAELKRAREQDVPEEAWASYMGACRPITLIGNMSIKGALTEFMEVNRGFPEPVRNLPNLLRYITKLREAGCLMSEQDAPNGYAPKRLGVNIAKYLDGCPKTTDWPIETSIQAGKPIYRAALPSAY